MIYISRYGYEPIDVKFTAEVLDAGAAGGRRRRGGQGRQSEVAPAAGSDDSEVSGSTSYSCAGNMFDFSDRFDWAVRVCT